MSYRVDTFDVKPARRTDQGFLVAEGRAARAGVLTYQQPDGSTRRELVPEEELQRTDSLGSIALKPITDDHPDDGIVREDNVTEEKKGVSLQKVQYMDGFVEVDILITDPELADAVERGDKEELSMGYHLDSLEEEPGEHPRYGPYDAIQRGRIANHIAVVEKGRAGPSVKVRTDSEDSDNQDIAFYHDKDTDMADKDQEPTEAQEPEEDRTDSGGEDLSDSAEALLEGAQMVQDAVEDLRADADDDEYEEKNDQLDAIADAMSGFVEDMEMHRQKADEMQAQLDALMDEFTSEEDKEDMEDDEERNDSADDGEDQTGMTRADMLDWHNERKELESVAEDLRVDSYEDKTNPELRRAIVEEHFGEDRQDATDAEIKGEFRAVKEIRKKREDSYDSASETVRQGRKEGTNKRRSDSAQERYRRRMFNGGEDPEARNDEDDLLDALADRLRD